jgi:ATP-dependent Clp protease protease subunit
MGKNLDEPMERLLMFNAQVNQDTIGKLSESILKINESDRELKKIYKLQGLKYKPKPIKIIIDSYGGYVYQCFGLLGVMESSKTPIHTIVTGTAMSCGFLIAITGHKRFAYRKATFLYHQLSSGAIGKLKEMEEEIVESKRLQKIIEEHTLQHTKITKKRLNEAFVKKEDWYIPVDECLELKLIDEII